MAQLGMHTIANDINKIEEERALRESARIEADKKMILDEAARLDKIKSNRELKARAFSEFKPFVKNTLLQYVIENMMGEAIGLDSMNEHDVRLMHHFSSSFIENNGGATNILMKVHGTTPLIEAIEDAINDTTDEVIAKVDKDDPTSYQVDKEDIISCINKIGANEDFQAAKEKIAAKVVSAENQFVAAQVQDKADMDEIINTAERRIAQADQDRDMDAETREAIKQEATRVSTAKINKIRENRNRGLFNEMVLRFSRSIMKSEILKEHYLDENGGLNTDAVVRSVRCMYSILETFSTTKLEKIDEVYIKDMLNEM